MKFETAILATLVIALFLPSSLCLPSSGYAVSDTNLSSAQARDYWPTTGWQNSTPFEQGMDDSILQGMVDHIIDEDLDVHSVIVVRNGYVILEEYPNPFQGQGRTVSINGTHYLYSTTKSFTSCLVGIALDKGFLANTSQTVLPIFPDMTFNNIDERKERITIDDLLTMRSGLPWDETTAPFSSLDNDVWHLYYNSSGGVQFTLDKPMEAEPGEYFHYNTGASHVLSGIVQEVTNMTSLEFAAENLFTPLGITTYFWPDDIQDVTFGGFDLQLRPLDMAKFGFLFLNGGAWDGEQVVSEDWVDESTTTVTTLSTTRGYARQWWTMPDLGVFYTAGMYGQYIFVSPTHDIVAVFTSGYGVSDIDENPQMLRDYILAAVIDPGADLLNTIQTILIIVIPIALIAIVVLYYRKTR